MKPNFIYHVLIFGVTVLGVESAGMSWRTLVDLASFLIVALTALVAGAYTHGWKNLGLALIALFYEKKGSTPVDALLYRAMGKAAFWSGVIGTLVGGIGMLSNMGGKMDYPLLFKAIAAAFVTTLYGAYAYALIFAPAAAKAERASVE